MANNHPPPNLKSLRHIYKKTYINTTKINSDRNKPRHVIGKLMKTENKKILKAFRRKHRHTHSHTHMTLTAKEEMEKSDCLKTEVFMQECNKGSGHIAGEQGNPSLVQEAALLRDVKG